MTDITTTMLVEVPFYDVDPMEIVWHGNYVKYFERARYRLLDLIGYNYAQMHESGYAWPVIDMRIKYIKPVKFAQKIAITATISEIEYCLQVDFLITDMETGERLTKAYTKQVAVDASNNEMCLLSPDVLKQKIADYHAK